LDREVSTIGDEIPVEEERISLDIAANQGEYQRQTIVIRKQIRLFIENRVDQIRSQSRSE